MQLLCMCEITRVILQLNTVFKGTIAIDQIKSEFKYIFLVLIVRLAEITWVSHLPPLYLLLLITVSSIKYKYHVECFQKLL